MEITDVRVRIIKGSGRMKAVASVTFDREFVVHDIKIIEGVNGMFAAMPSKKIGSSYKDIAHPLSPMMREKISRAILEKYDEALSAEGLDQRAVEWNVAEDGTGAAEAWDFDWVEKQ